MGHEMHRLSTRTASRFVSLYTPFLPGHTHYEIVKVLERPRQKPLKASLKNVQETRQEAHRDPIFDSSFDSRDDTFCYSSILTDGQKCTDTRSIRPKNRE